MASVYVRKMNGRPYGCWMARIPVFKKGADGVVRKTWGGKSTGVDHTKSRRKALQVAQVYEQLSVDHAPDSQWRNTRVLAQKAVDDILQINGLESAKPKPSFRVFAQNWLVSRSSLADSSKQGYQTTISQVVDFLGERADQPLSELTTADFEEFYAQRCDSASIKTANWGLKTIRTIFDRAVDHGYLEKNPAKLIELRRERGRYDRQVFTDEEIGRILAEVQSDPEMELAVLFGLFYGMRLSDAVARTAAEFQVVEDGGWTLSFEQKKTGDRLCLPIPDLFGLREKIGARIEAAGAQGYLTPGLAQMAKKSAWPVGKRFLQILRRAGIDPGQAPGKKATKSFHSLRATSKTMMVRKGVDSATANKINGHKSESAAAVYLKPEFAQMERSLIQTWGDLGGGQAKSAG